MRLARRYICAAVIFTSLFWLLLDFTALFWNSRVVDSSTLDVNKRNEDTEDIVNIDYFRRYYKTMLDPQPGSAGMNGQGVENPESEKEKEDKGLNDHGFNELSSSKISLERTIPDNRHSRFVFY